MPAWLHTHMPLWELLLRLLLATLFGALVGWDRQARGQPAGLRTHMMVALGSAGFAVIAMEFLAQARESGVGLGEPLHIIAAVVGGVGFLGAGAIMQTGGQIKGLTTAAGLWVVAGVGTAAGSGMYLVAALLTIFAAATHSLVRRLEASYPAKSDRKESN